MLKYLMLGVFLWQGEVNDVYGHGEVDDMPPPIIPGTIPPLRNDSRPTLHVTFDAYPAAPSMNGKFNFYATQQIFYMSGASTENVPIISDDSVNNNLKKFGPGYVLAKGIGALKVQANRIKWNRARRICAADGGHLAIIRSEAEERIIIQMMMNNSIEEAWVGYHDRFEEGDWLTVLDESFEQTGWARWSKKWSPNPDNYGGKQHCAQLLTFGGIDDLNCDDMRPFICKINV